MKTATVVVLFLVPGVHWQACLKIDPSEELDGLLDLADFLLLTDGVAFAKAEELAAIGASEVVVVDEAELVLVELEKLVFFALLNLLETVGLGEGRV